MVQPVPAVNLTPSAPGAGTAVALRVAMPKTVPLIDLSPYYAAPRNPAERAKYAPVTAGDYISRKINLHFQTCRAA